MYVIGLTGGIGSGKSTVAAMLGELGAVILSADIAGHEVYLPGRPAWQEIVDAFGRDVVAEDGTIDRAKLRDIVFSGPEQLALLNSITHPRMKELMREKLAALEREGVRIAVLEAALLFDAGWDDLTNEVWVTVAPPGVAARRASERTGIPVEQVMERIQKAQMSEEERMRRSQIVIDNGGSVQETQGQIEREWGRLQQRLAASAKSSV